MEASHRFLRIPSMEKGVFVSIIRWMSVMGALIIGIMMLLDVADVTGRYFFLKPLTGAMDIIAILLVWAGSWGMAYAEATHTVIEVGILVDRLSPRVQAIISSFAYLISLVFFLVISWQLIVKGAKEAVKESGSWVSVTLGIPFSPFLIIFGIGVGMLSITFVIRLIHSIGLWLRR
jgi:TRAP-type C4-dicarboxylate transport system permease small subunit